MTDDSRLRGHWINVVVLLAYFGVALGITWPLVTQITTHLPGGSQDTLVHYWNGWWAKQALTTGRSPYYTPYLYYPTGMDLTYHNFAWINIVLWLVLEPLAGGFAAYNLSILVNLALCGFTAFILAYELTGDRRAAFLAGLIYQCWPYRLSQPDHPNLISTQWIPLYLLFLIRVVRSGKWRDAVLAGAFVALTGYTRWQQLIPAAIIGGIYLVCVLPSRLVAWRRWVPPLLLTGIVAILALTPPALRLIRHQRTAPAELLREDEEANMQTDLLAYLTPGRSHPLLGSLTGPAYERYYTNRYENRRFAAYIGGVALTLVVLGVWNARRASLPWMAMALVLILLALGPTLRLNGKLYPGIPMPYRLASRLYVVRLMRIPDRYNMFLALPAAMLSAYGATHVLTIVQRHGKRYSKWATLGTIALLGGVILFEYSIIPMPLHLPEESQFYHRLATESENFAVLNLPISQLESKRYMFAQITHQHSILQGKTPRFPQGTFDFLDNHSWIQTLRESSTMPPEHTDVSRQLAALAQDGVQYVILHKTSVHPLRLHHWRRYFVVPPDFEDELIVVYPTAPRAGRDFALMDELAPGIGPIRVVTPTGCLNPGWPLEVGVGWGTTAPQEQDWNVRLALVTDGDVVHHEQIFPLLADWSTREWPANTIAWGYYELSVPPSLPSRAYTITLTLVDAATGAVESQQAHAAHIVVNNPDCPLQISPDVTRVDALFGDELHLLGYQLSHAGDQLTVTLHWYSRCLMENDYVIFVHILNPATGLRVAQDDSMPLRWGFPTTYWGAGDVVVDDIPLSLENAPAGAYSIIVGVYDFETSQRLPVMDGSGEIQPNGQLALPGGTVEVSGP